MKRGLIFTAKNIINKQDYIFSLYIFKYKHLFNSISQPHLRNILYLCSKTSSDKYFNKNVSEI